jgi:hypothetical protein
LLEHDSPLVERLAFRDGKREIDSIVFPWDRLAFSQWNGFLVECDRQSISERVPRFRGRQPDDNELGVCLAMNVRMDTCEWIEDEVGDVYGCDTRFFVVITRLRVRRASCR